MKYYSKELVFGFPLFLFSIEIFWDTQNLANLLDSTLPKDSFHVAFGFKLIFNEIFQLFYLTYKDQNYDIFLTFSAHFVVNLSSHVLL